MAETIDLVVRNADRTISLTPGQVLIAGRTAQCDLQLEDPSVSRRHCSITFENGLLRVLDLQSANGTFVNERPVAESTARPGDLIRLGAAILEVRDPSGTIRRPDETYFVEDSTVESIIQRRIEPSSFDWLAGVQKNAAPELALLERAQRHLSTLHRVSELLAGARDINHLTDATLRAILEVVQADRCAIVLRRKDDAAGQDVLAARSRTQATERFAVSRTLVSSVIRGGVSIFAHDASSDARFSEGQSVIGQRVRSVMCVPLRPTDDILGARRRQPRRRPLQRGGPRAARRRRQPGGRALHRVRLMESSSGSCSIRSRRSPPRSTRATATRTGIRSAWPRSSRSSRASWG